MDGALGSDGWPMCARCGASCELQTPDGRWWCDRHYVPGRSASLVPVVFEGWWLSMVDGSADLFEVRGDLAALMPELDPATDLLTVHVVAHDGRVACWAGCSSCGGQSGVRSFSVAEAVARLDSFGLLGWMDHHTGNGHGSCPTFGMVCA